MGNDARTATAYLGLGSNLGDRLAALRAAVEALHLAEHVSVEGQLAVASLYESAPLAPPSERSPQGPFLNSAVRVQTALEPHELLRTALAIEDALGRVRRRRWEARIIDIDVLLYDDIIVNEVNLTLPHPGLHLRRFVLDPLADIAPDVVHPTMHTTIRALAVRATAAHPAEAATRIMGNRWASAIRPLRPSAATQQNAT